MNPGTRALFAKEIRLQRANLLFALAVAVVGALLLYYLGHTDRDFSSFTAKDIRAGLFVGVLLPVFILILPLMIGSTAAASEKNMGVSAWHTALPISWRRVILVKAAVIAAACAVVAGLIPYLLHLLTGDDIYFYSRIFRTWPGWIAMLFGAIGFYSGTLARDDYHGLLISGVPLVLIGLVMWLADPFMQVSPVQPWQYVWRQWALVLRLLIIAAVIVVLAAVLLKRADQPRRRLVIRQALLLIPLVYLLTLVNVMYDKTLLDAGSDKTDHRPVSQFEDMRHVLSRPIATVDGITAERPGFYPELSLTDFHRSDSSTRIGTVVVAQRNQSDEGKWAFGHYFTINQQRQIREFPQASAMLEGYSENGRWLWVTFGEKMHVLCGPGGITVNSLLMPDSWFHSLRTRLRILPLEPDYQARSTAVNPRQLINTAAAADQVVFITGADGILWKGGRKHIPPGLKATQLNIGHGKRLADTMPEAVPGDRLPRMVAVPFTNEFASTVTAILKPTYEPTRYELAGWINGKAEAVSPDYSWCRTAETPRSNSGPDAYIKRFSFTELSTDLPTTAPASRTWELQRFQVDPDGTTTTLYWFHRQFPIIQGSDGEYTFVPYRKTGPVAFAGASAADDFPFEEGILMLNLDTGQQQLVPTPMPWPMPGTLRLQQREPMSWPAYYFTWPEHHWDQATGQLALTRDNTIGFTYFLEDNWKDGTLDFNYGYIPGLRESTFPGEHFLATDGRTLYTFPGPRESHKVQQADR